MSAGWNLKNHQEPSRTINHARATMLVSKNMDAVLNVFNEHFVQYYTISETFFSTCLYNFWIVHSKKTEEPAGTGPGRGRPDAQDVNFAFFFDVLCVPNEQCEYDKNWSVLFEKLLTLFEKLLTLVTVRRYIFIFNFDVGQLKVLPPIFTGGTGFQVFRVFHTSQKSAQESWAVARNFKQIALLLEDPQFERVL